MAKVRVASFETAGQMLAIGVQCQSLPGISEAGLRRSVSTTTGRLGHLSRLLADWASQVAATVRLECTVRGIL